MTVIGPEPDLTPAEIIDRAEVLARDLPRRQAETEERTFYGLDTHNAFLRAGFYRLLVPRRYGGYEFGVDTFMRVATTLARGCPSTGWMYLFGAAHALAVATLFDEPAQAELFAVGDFICPATVAPTGRARQTASGDWHIQGRFPYSSGAPYATHFLGHALVEDDSSEPPATLMFVVARSQWTRSNDWGGQLGLRGSGSHTIVIDDALVPRRHTRIGHLSQFDVTEGTPGRVLHANPEYGGGPLSFMLLELGALAVGMARGALDVYEASLRTRLTAFTPIGPRHDDPDYQWRYGEATGLIETADAALQQAVAQWQAACRGEPSGFSRANELRLASISREVIRLCWSAVSEHIVATVGSSAMACGERMERVWRDMSMLASHAGYGVFLSTLANRELARATFAGA